MLLEEKEELRRKKESCIDSLLLSNPLNHFTALNVAIGHCTLLAVNLC